MLKQLYIQNYALIEEITVDFPGALTVITGETGAGKSILLGALGLILGDRADSSVLNNKEKKCVIEGTFFIKAYKLKSFFEKTELDYADETSVRREISADGKSRAFINDTPVTLQLLKQLGEKLVDIHSQHETLFLKETSFQFEVLDSFAGILTEKENYKKYFFELKTKEKQLKELLEKENKAKKDLDYFTFQFNELEEAAVKPGELKELENEAATLENAELIRGNLSKATLALSGGDENFLSKLSAIKILIAQVSKYGTELSDLDKRIQSVYIELKELAGDIESAEEKISADPQRLDEINSKTDKLNRLLKKHSLNSEEELLTLKNDLETKISEIGSMEKEILRIEKEIKEETLKVKKQATELHKKRSQEIPLLEKEIAGLLAKLSMPNAKFKCEIIESAELNINGCDELRFMFSANKGVDFKELHKVASGGELSRLMLAIKSIIAKLTALPAIIFDEIDTGVSGDVAAKMGGILEKMSNGMQVISITHLPQIASRGKHHLFVYKQDIKNKTVSFIKELNEADRVMEIAKMLSTGKPTEAALLNAKELLKN